MGLISPGGQNLLDFLELRLVLSIFDGAIKEAKAGKVEYRLDKTNIIHCPIGKVSFGADKLYENYVALIGAINKAKPAAAKGQYIRSCVTASTMGPGVKINAQKQL